MKIVDFEEHNDVIEHIFGDESKMIGYSGYAIVELNNTELSYLSDDDYTLDDFINDENNKDFIKNNPEMTPLKSLELVEPTIKQAMYEINLVYEPKTVASATLHGQGEYPPSTLEELCESYKNVMSK